MFNWSRERQKLKTEIFQNLRDQADTKLKAESRGSFTVDTLAFAAKGESLVLGPYRIHNVFNTPPLVNITQLPAKDSSLVVLPYIASWEYAKGQVAGFYLGVYTLRAAKTQDVGTKHTFYWSAQGRSSRYQGRESQVSYDSGYNLDLVPHLESNF